MKKCPFCAEEIQDEAIKCRFCGEFFDQPPRSQPKVKWYYSTSAVVVGLLCLGPLALPLVWINPKYTAVTKVIVSIVVIAATVWFSYLAGDMYQQVIQQINTLGLR